MGQLPDRKRLIIKQHNVFRNLEPWQVKILFDRTFIDLLNLIDLLIRSTLEWDSEEESDVPAEVLRHPLSEAQDCEDVLSGLSVG
ncbi:hypothetical protein NPIL_77671 [Nephila pilipes]|uniref:Uncharacterized protein n=1 Tax=Nephila pilipes TaxID=299642 RepID=A0A8X6QPK6_NEPPI|nr:hypothetical protein NPIL_77671 [Nephila pilipes]